MVLLIVDAHTPLVQELSDRYKAFGEEVVVFLEMGRCITPMEKDKRRQIESEGKRGQSLAASANSVYLIRGERVERIK